MIAVTHDIGIARERARRAQLGLQLDPPLEHLLPCTLASVASRVRAVSQTKRAKDADETGGRIVRLERDFGYDGECGAAAAQGCEERRMLVGRAANDRAVRGHDGELEDVCFDRLSETISGRPKDNTHCRLQAHVADRMAHVRLPEHSLQL